MDSGLLEILSPVIGLTVNVASQVGLKRYKEMRLLKSVFAGFFAGLGTVLILGLAGCSGLGIILANTAIYFCLGYGYFHFINLGETARRIRILQEINAAPEGLTLEEILARYNAGEILDKRFQRLLDNGQVRLENGNYVMRPSLMVLITRIFILTRKMIMGSSGGKGGAHE